MNDMGVRMANRLAKNPRKDGNMKPVNVTYINTNREKQSTSGPNSNKNISIPSGVVNLWRLLGKS
jgi:hypothetical protein